MPQQINLVDPASKATVLSLLNAGNVSDAKLHAQSLVDQAPLDCETQYVFGLSLLMAEDYEQAIEWLKKAVEQRSDDAVMNANLGVAYLRSDDLDNAIKYLEKASARPRGVLGMFDVSARPYVPKNTLSFAVPMKKFVRMIEHMDESFLITPSWDKVRKRIVNA